MSRKKKLIMSLQSPHLFTLKRLQGVSTKIFKTRARFQSTAAASKIDPKWESAKPFNAIPGPKPLPIPFGNLWKFTRFGPYGNLDFLRIHERLAKEYGPIVRITGVGREDVVYLYDADYIETMFRNDGIWPTMDFVQSLVHYMEKNNIDMFNHGTIGLDQGSKWRSNKTSVRHIAAPKQAVIYTKPVDEVANIFINKMKSLKDSNSEMPKDFHNELSKFALEAVFNYTLDTRLNCLERNWNSESDAAKIITTSRALIRNINKLDLNISLPMWQYITTPTWRKFSKSNDIFYGTCGKYVHMKIQEIQEKMKNENYQPNSPLEILYNEDKSAKLAAMMAITLIFGGVEPVAVSVGSALSHLSKNPDKQERLFQELKKFLPNKESIITAKTLNELKYLKACIKESMRMSSPGFGNQRRAGRDYVIDQYRIPKGTSVMSINYLVSKDKKNFENPDNFIPERWLREEKDLRTAVHPFASLPFGFGPRMCMGKRFADLELEIMIAKIIRNFKVEYKHGDMIWKFDGNYKCAKPLQFRIEDRRE